MFISKDGGLRRGGCSRIVHGQSSLQLSKSTKASAGWILCAAQVPSGTGSVLPRHLSVQKEYITVPFSSSTRQCCCRGHFNKVLQELQMAIR